LTTGWQIESKRPQCRHDGAVCRSTRSTIARGSRFFGGAVTGLLITDQGHPSIRPTEDVDLFVYAAVHADYQRIEASLRKRGFVNDLGKDAPICRWRIGDVIVDVMPTLEEVLGFSNRWYPLALETAQPTALPSGITIRLITAPVFIGTKFEAFANRGKFDYLFSHDLGDLISVIDGREELLMECEQTDSNLQKFLGEKISTLLSTAAFLDALPGHLPGDFASQERLPRLIEKMREFAMLYLNQGSLVHASQQPAQQENSRPKPIRNQPRHLNLVYGACQASASPDC
jgi:hypothetical protein